MAAISQWWRRLVDDEGRRDPDMTPQLFDGRPRNVAHGYLKAPVSGGLDAEIHHHLVDTADAAEACTFSASPTVLINGIGSSAEPDAGVGLSCRVFRTPSGPDGSPTLDRLSAATAPRQG